ncbi:hypothetical protein [Dyella sp. 20L07]|uniref:hypothetical protein n=1 Tax=Dyella sp. 20L07 TaxID=3384240 RepID=UPI003D290E42
MISLEQAFAEIVLLHEQIEAWFRGDAPPHALNALVACFADEFQMVTIRGDQLDRDGVRNLFLRLHGTRPGMTIVIERVTVMVDGSDGCLVTYRETQTSIDGSSNQRHSVVWLRPTSNQRPSWLYLQETALS